jgi:signal transduction histidine kinase
MGLCPVDLKGDGLANAFSLLAATTSSLFRIDCRFICEKTAHIEDEIVATQLYYIAHEAVNNARKHAQAGHIWVRLKAIEGDMIMLEIEDDGVGFNVGAVDAFYEQRGSLGMVNMRERAEMINGAVKIDSADGRGTRVVVYIPLTDLARERMRT